MTWEFYVQAGLGLFVFLLSFGKGVKIIALLEIERDLKAGKKTPGYQAWIRRNQPLFFRIMGAALIGMALINLSLK